MPIFAGNTSTSATSTAYNNPVRIKSFSVSNKTGGAVNVSVSMLYGSTNILISEYNKSVAANGILDNGDREYILPIGYKIYVLVSGNCDYCFSMENI